jgi:virginiamycin B lyase
LLVGLAMAIGAEGAASAPTVRVWSVPPWDNYIRELAAGPDRAMWFVHEGKGDITRISRISTSGKIRHFSLPANTSAGELTAGPGDALWFTASVDDYSKGAIGRITTDGKVDFFPLPDPDFVPRDLARGPDGTVWFFETGESSDGKRVERRIGRIDTTGSITEHSLGKVSARYLATDSIARGADGAMWFTDSAVGRVGRITKGGSVKHFKLSGFWSPRCVDSSGGHFTCSPASIIAGPRNKMWFMGLYGDRIVEISSGGKLRFHRVPMVGRQPTILRAIGAGPGGAVWFVTGVAAGRIAPSGAIAQYPIVGRNGVEPALTRIVAGPDATMWFIARNKVGRIK